LALNVALAGWLWWRLVERPPAAALPPLEVSSVTTNFVRQIRRGEAPAPSEAASPISQTPWSLIETNDYIAYVANLRAVGCPEPVLRHVILADVGKLFEGRIARRQERNPWLTGSQAAARERLEAREQRELSEQKRALIKELLGIDWWEKAHEELMSQPEVELLTGFLAEDKQLRLVNLLFSAQSRKESIEHETGGILIPEDEENIRRLAELLRGELAGLLAPSQLDEVQMRILAVDGDLEIDGEWPGLNLTAPEFREIVKLKGQGKDILAEIFNLDNDANNPEIEEAREELYRAGVEKLLGTERFHAFVRTEDGAFKEAWNVAKEFKLPVQSAAQAYEVRQAAQAEIRRLGSDASLGKEQREAALQAVGEEVRRAILSAFGPDGAREYLEQRGDWIPGATQKKQP